MKKKILLILLTICGILTSVQCCYAQDADDLNAIKGFLHSPNVASLGIFGQIPVSLFTGVPDINIPLYSTRSYNNVSVDIALMYHTNLVKPRTVPSWVGLGWALSAGGSITRIPNGPRDEAGIAENLLYINNYQRLDNDNWATPIFYQSQEDLSLTFAMAKDFQPDEFTFSFGNYSGSFWLNHLGEWQVRSSNGMPLKIEAKLSDTGNQIPSIYIANYELGVCHPTKYEYERSYMQFTITTEDGTQYIFGSMNSDSKSDFCEEVNWSKNNNYIEGTHVKIARGISGELYSSMDVPTGHIDTWHLRKIITPDNSEINFNYKRKRAIVTSVRYIHEEMQTVIVGLPPVFSYSWDEAVLIQTPSYLQSITTDDCMITFHSSTSTQMQPTVIPVSYIDSKWEQLDSILIKTRDDTLIKKIVFNYTNTAQERLKLLSVADLGNGSTNENMTYSFSYNSKKLPAYDSSKLDHWGYYNGITYFSPETIESDRSVVNFSCLKAELLEQITYPTGGKTLFEYEPHEYSKYVKPSTTLADNHYKLSDYVNNTQTGGLRVKRIQVLDSNDNIVKDTKYYYSINYPETGISYYISSGILAGKPYYYDKYIFKCGKDSSNAFIYIFDDKNPGTLSFTNGSHITYSEVVELEEENGFTIYNYTNFNTSEDYRDIRGSYNKLSENQLNYVFSSKAFMRGKLSKKREYSKDKRLKRETTYKYELYPERERFVRAIIPWNIAGMCGVIVNIGACYKFWTNNYNLTKQIIYKHEENNMTTDSIIYNYNQHNLLSSQLINQGNGIERFTYFSYPFDYMNKDSVLSRMTNKHILSNYIEKIVGIGKGSTVNMINFERRNYDEVFPNIFKTDRIDRMNSPSPINMNTWMMSGLAFNQFVNPEVYYKYDNKGNIIEVKSANSQFAIAYLWGYNGQYPIAELQNTTYDEFMNSLSDSQKSFLNYVLGQTMTPDNSVYKSFRDLLMTTLPNAEVTTYTYTPLIGVTSITDPRGHTIYYDYDSFGRLREIYSIENGVKQAVEGYEYHYKN